MTRKVALGEVAEVFNGKTPAKADQRTAGHPVLKIRDVDPFGSIRGNFESFVDLEFAEKFRKKQLRQGDILILNAAHNADYVASKTFFASKKHQGPLVTGEWTIVRPIQSVVDSRYVRRYIESAPAKKFIKEMVNGIHLYPKDVAKCMVPLLSLVEQCRIAVILDKADALRAKRREAIAKINRLLQSVFVEMFGDPVKNSKGWRLVRVGDVVSEFVGGKNVECPDESSSPFRILKVSAVTSKLYKPEESKPAPELFSPSAEAIVRVGDLLFSRANTTELVAATAYVWDTPDNMVLPDKLWKLRIADDALLNPLFLWELFRNPVFRGDLSKRSSGTSGSMKNISKSKLELMPMPLPPIADQERFAAFSRRMHQQLASLQKAASGMDDLFSSLQKSAFSGS